MSVIIPDDILQASGLSEKELLQEIILVLFQQKRISIGKASNLLGMNLIQFQHLLASRDLYIHYDLEDLQTDVATLKRLGRFQETKLEEPEFWIRGIVKSRGIRENALSKRKNRESKNVHFHVNGDICQRR